MPALAPLAASRDDRNKQMSLSPDARQPAPHSHSLAFDANPAYKAYLDTAFALGILSTDVDVCNLLSRYYLNLGAPTDEAANQPGACQLYITPWNTIARFCMFGLLREQRPPFEIGQASPAAIVEWAVHMLSLGGYVYATVNDCFIPGTRAHAAREAYNHPCLITACDAAAQTFAVSTYLANGSYGSTRVRYADWSRAFTERGDPRSMSEIHFYEPVLHGILRANAPFGLQAFDPLATASVLVNYVECRLDKYALCEQEVYGLDAVRAFMQRLVVAIRSGEEPDLRGTRTLMEHRRILVSVFEHAREQLHLTGLERVERAFKALESWAGSLHSLAFDHQQTRGVGRSRAGASRLLKHIGDIDRMLRMDKRAALDFIDALVPLGLGDATARAGRSDLGRMWLPIA